MVIDEANPTCSVGQVFIGVKMPESVHFCIWLLVLDSSAAVNHSQCYLGVLPRELR